MGQLELFWSPLWLLIFYISVNFLTHNKRRNSRERSQKSIVFQEEKQTVNRERKRKSEEQTSGLWTLNSSLNFCLHSLASITLFT